MANTKQSIRKNMMAAKNGVLPKPSASKAPRKNIGKGPRKTTAGKTTVGKTVNNPVKAKKKFRFKPGSKLSHLFITASLLIGYSGCA